MFDEIPTDDPGAALKFTRALQALLNKNGAGEDSQAPEISVVIPVLNEIGNLPELFSRLQASLEGVVYEVVFVDDGSSDGSTKWMQDMAGAQSRVRLVELSRNFGHQIAISAGLDYAWGRGVIIMDSDLQDPPEVLPQFIEKWREGFDVVYAVRKRRKEPWLKRLGYAFFYRLFKRLASFYIPIDSGDFCLMDRKVVDLLNGMPERNRFVRGIRSWVGLRQVGLEYERDARKAGYAKFTFTRLIYLALDGLVSFSFIPLRAISLLGLAISLGSIVLAVFYTIQRLTVGLSPPGFATIVVAVLFLAGVQLITLGVTGEYVGRIFEEVKKRPLYVVRQVTN